MNAVDYQGAWLTDIDDTLVLSGEIPGEERMASLTAFINVLKEYGILWIPMSGVALVKLGPRILFKLPEQILSHVLYYGGDGSLKYTFNSTARQWEEDPGFSQLFSDPQTWMIIGEDGFRSALKEEIQLKGGSVDEIDRRMDRTRMILKEKDYNPDDCALDALKRRLAAAGYDPSVSETYFRGGSVSWMMLGDISADPYHTPEAELIRQELIRMSKKWLKDRDHLRDLGSRGINVPFPGARGIKFVLMGNNKERAARDLLAWTGLKSENILFAGNELFAGGNDNMLRNIEGVTLLSVGEREDPGPNVITGRRKEGSHSLEGVKANQYWMDWTVERLRTGQGWKDILRDMAGASHG